MFGWSPYAAVLFVHVFAAITLVGSTLLSPSIGSALRHATSVSEVRGIMSVVLRASKSKPLVALLLLGSGVYLGSAGWWAQPWFYVGVAAWVTNAVLGGAVVHRVAEALAAAAAQAPDGPVGDEVDRLRRSASWNLATAVMIANDIAIVYVMFTKPELPGAVALLLGANAVAIALHFRRQLVVARAPRERVLYEG